MHVNVELEHSYNQESLPDQTSLFYLHTVSIRGASCRWRQRDRNRTKVQEQSNQNENECRIFTWTKEEVDSPLNDSCRLVFVPESSHVSKTRTRLSAPQMKQRVNQKLCDSVLTTAPDAALTPFCHRSDAVWTPFSVLLWLSSLFCCWVWTRRLTLLLWKSRWQLCIRMCSE